MRRNVTKLIAAVILLLLAACTAPAPSASAPEASGEEAAAAGEPRAGGTLTVVLDGEIDTIDAHKSVTIVGNQVWPNIFESLVQQNANLDTVEPLLAESWEQPDDVTYVFTLRQGVTFHNGKDFKAEDVKYSFDRIMDEATASSRRPDFLPVASVEVVDDYTVQFTMNAPYGPFLSKLENLSIMPSNQTTDPAQDPIGTGPFVFKEWITGQTITLDKNPNYWQEGLPYLDSIVYRPIAEPSTRIVELQTGNVQVVNAVPAKDVATLEADANVTVHRNAGVTRDHVGFNMESPIFKDNPNLRKAIAWAIDRQTIADTLVYGLASPADVAIPTSHWAYNPAVEGVYGFDLAKAKEFYDQADPKPTEIVVKVSPTYPDEVKMAELMQASLKEIGLDLQIEQLEWSTWIDTVVVNGDYDIEIVLISGGSDPDDFFYQWHHTGEVFNIQRYSDPDMDAMLDEGRTTVDQEARKEIYYQIQDKLLEDLPMAHIIYRDQIMATTAAVQNFPMRLDSRLFFVDTWLSE
jgi:peptide/nickel transport system substrate-binding protein